MSHHEAIPTESYSTFWDEAQVEVADELIEIEDPYAEFLAATEDEPASVAGETD